MDGTTSSINATPTTRAGGGGGGSMELRYWWSWWWWWSWYRSNAGAAGTANTGGGGGGSWTVLLSGGGRWFRYSNNKVQISIIMTSKIKVDNIENQCGGAVVTKCGGTTTISRYSCKIK